MRLILAFLALFWSMAAVAAERPRQRSGPLVLAAASLQEAMGAAADRWAAKGHARPVISSAASSALARQVQAGAAADLFVSADGEWMDLLAREQLIVPETRADLVGNRLVLVAPRAFRGQLTRATLGPALARGPLAMADPRAVPAGRYGQAALQRLGAWAAVAPRVVRAENVRAALALVERGAAPFGVVYLTDGRSSSKVRVVAVFPTGSHPAIRYPIARLTASTHPEAEGFRRFLLSAEGRAVLARFGFSRP